MISREETKREFLELLNQTYALFGNFDFSDGSHENLDRLIKLLSDSELSERFEKNFRKLTAILNLPRAKTYLMAYVEKYKTLAKAYGVYVNNLKLGNIDEQKVSEAYERVKKIISENFFLDVENRGGFTIDRSYLDSLGKTKDYASALRALNQWHTEISNRRFRYPDLLERIVNAYQKLMTAKEVNEGILREIKAIKENVDAIDAASASEGETMAAFKEAISSVLKDVDGNTLNEVISDLSSRKGVALILKNQNYIGKSDRKSIKRSIRYSVIKVLKPDNVQDENSIVEGLYQKLRDTFGF